MQRIKLCYNILTTHINLENLDKRFDVIDSHQCINDEFFLKGQNMKFKEMFSKFCYVQNIPPFLRNTHQSKFPLLNDEVDEKK